MDWTIKLKNLSLKYGKIQALNNVSFSLSDKKIYGLLGRNGAGKTSLLSIIASFQRQTEGSIEILGKEPYENRKIMREVGFFYHKDLKDEPGTVKEMIDDAKRYRPNFDENYANFLLERFKLSPEREVKKLSKGMQAALNATVGLASRTPITIFDETYNGMDAPTREIFYEEILNDQANVPRLMIISTHLVSEMEYLFDEILILHNGKLLLQEDYESLISKGSTVLGNKEEVDAFVRSKKQLHSKELGNMKQVTILGELSDGEKEAALKKGLEIGSVSLHELFIHLTGEEA